MRRVCKEPRRVGGRLALLGVALSDLLQLGFRFVVRDQPGALAALHDLPNAVVDDLKVAEAGRDRRLALPHKLGLDHKRLLVHQVIEGLSLCARARGQVAVRALR